MSTAPLPIYSAIPSLQAALADGNAAVLHAPPGAGKTTVVPLELRQAPWLGDQRIIMLEPRRLAARAAAARLAQTLGERVGQTVGHRMRQDTKVSAATRIEVVTEGVLTRMLQTDPSLDGVGLVIFDEYHERSLQADLGLAFCLETQAALRPDLRLLVMSATLDTQAVSTLLDDAPILGCDGRMYPVDTRYADRAIDGDVVRATAGTIRRALADETGSVLVFLPGQGEIRRCHEMLAAESLPPDTTVYALFGDLSRQDQDAAIAPCPSGQRKVVLATAIAETSLTIDGVRVVVDAGLSRYPVFDAGSGMERLVTRPVSVASADQRRGRAGRLEPGVCYRLWTEVEHSRLPAHTPPEILGADLAPLALELANWGARDPAELSWPDPPPAAAMEQAQELLRELDALDADGAVTPHGRELLTLPVHPRLAHMLRRGQDLRLGSLACDLAALLSERDILIPQAGYRDTDLRLRLELLWGGAGTPGTQVHRGALHRVRQSADDLRRRLRIDRARSDAEDAGRLIALAYPDRVAESRSAKGGRFRMRNGRGAKLGRLDITQPLSSADYLAIAELDGDAREAAVYQAAPLTLADIESLFADQIRDQAAVSWDSRSHSVQARRQRRLGALVLQDGPMQDPPADAVTAALITGIRERGLSALPWSRDAEELRARVCFAAHHQPADWPDWTDDALLATLPDWLGPWLDGITRLDDLRRLKLLDILRNALGYSELQKLERLAPTHLQVPSGSNIRLDYSQDPPVLAVRLQEMFGQLDTPRLLDGRVPVLIHLLSPAQRPVQVTQDLASFWSSTYEQVRKDLRGRYPKHYWPDDPTDATPTRRTRPKK